jgi:hypothetical protein
MHFWQNLAGDTELELDHVEAAVSHFRNAISLNPNQLPSYVGLAAAHALSGNMSQAHAYIAELLKVAPHWSRETLLKRFGGRGGKPNSRVGEGFRLALSSASGEN